MSDESNKSIEGEVVEQTTPVLPTKHDEKVVQQFELAFQNGFNITEACHYVGIHRDTFYDWLRDDDAFSYRMSIARTAINRKAKTNVMLAINSGDPHVSLAFLKLRDPDFNNRGNNDVDTGDEKVEEKLKEFMNDTDDDAYPVTTDVVSPEPTSTTEPESGTEVAPSTPAI